MAIEKIHDGFVAAPGDFGVGDHVSEIAERQELVALARALERVGKFQAVGEVDVVVDRAVHEQQGPRQAIGVGQRRAGAVHGWPRIHPDLCAAGLACRLGTEC